MGFVEEVILLESEALMNKGAVRRVVGCRVRLSLSRWTLG